MKFVDSSSWPAGGSAVLTRGLLVSGLLLIVFERNRALPGRPSELPGWGRRTRQKGCAQCAHFGRRTGAYWGRIGPDSACFRGIPVFAGAGMQFESHLGHA